MSEDRLLYSRASSDREGIDPLLPGPHGAGNDYSFITRALRRLDGDWPRVRASVIVPVYNRRPILEKTLAALCSQQYPRALFEVIVADDGSSDHPEELLERFRDRLNVRVVRQADKGFRVAAARNLAIRAATGDVIVSLDCDMLPVRGWLTAMLAPFHVYDGALCTIGYRRNVDTSSVGASEILRDPGVVDRLSRVPAPQAARLWWAPTLDWRVPLYWRSRMLRTSPVPYGVAAGGNLAYWKRDALAVGLHDDTFTHWGGEDDEFAYRLYRHGAYFMPVRRAVAYHQAHSVTVPREQHRRETRRMLGRKVPRYRRFSEDGAWEAPKVSVCIRAQNAERSVARAIDSALAQTLTDLEVCVCDDGSTDGTASVLARYAANPRVRIAHISIPGVSAASNAAARASRGELILQLGADDELLPHAAATLAQTLDSDSDIAVAYSGYELAGDAGQIAGRHVPGAYSAYDHLHRNVISPARMLRARDFWRAGGWDEGLAGAEDYDLTLRICERGLARAVPQILHRHYPRHDGAIPAGDGASERSHDIEAVRRALARRGIPAHVERFDPEHPERVVVHFNRRLLSRMRRWGGLFAPRSPRPATPQDLPDPL